MAPVGLLRSVDFSIHVALWLITAPTLLVAPIHYLHDHPFGRFPADVRSLDGRLHPRSRALNCHKHRLLSFRPTQPFDLLTARSAGLCSCDSDDIERVACDDITCLKRG